MDNHDDQLHREYNPGAVFNTARADTGEQLVWIGTNREDARIVSVLDPNSTIPARRVLADGSCPSLPGEPTGLNVYGTHRGDRPDVDTFARHNPEHAHLTYLIPYD